MDVQVEYRGRSFPVEAGQSVLEALEQGGESVPSSCRAGVCQTCLMRATDGAPPQEAQVGLAPSLRDLGYFLACLCQPKVSMACTTAGDALPLVEGQLTARQLLSEDVVLLRVAVPQGFHFKGGQYVNLVRADGLTRSYSIASLPADGAHVDLHVRRVPGGEMSEWLHVDAGPGTCVGLRGPLGDCVYGGGGLDEELILAGTGTGLAPLYAVLRDALAQGHRGPITLFHGGLSAGRLYLVEELRRLEREYANVQYVRCLMEGGGDAGDGVRLGNLVDVVVAAAKGKKAARAYVCGDAAIVNLLKKKLFLAGLSAKSIHADAFVSGRRA